ncbi:hypothetical protein Btru_011748 [Bulinus truncatus]|nr:hypothetical protein Btru_011748 [Bulinus truncatus]
MYLGMSMTKSFNDLAVNHALCSVGSPEDKPLTMGDSNDSSSFSKKLNIMDTSEVLSESSTVDELLPPTHYNRHFNCNECHFETTHGRDFYYHKRDIHGNTAKIFECQLCSFASLYGKKLERHMILHKVSTLDEEGSFSSKFSPTLTTDEQNISGADQIDTPRVKPLTLKRLNVKMPFKVSKMKNKLKIMKDGSKFKGIYYEHIITHVGHGYMKCPDCSYVTGARSNYEKHRSFHTDGYPVKCSVCNFGAESESKIKRHVATQHMPDLASQPPSLEGPSVSEDIVGVLPVGAESEDYRPVMNIAKSQPVNEYAQASTSQGNNSSVEEELFEYRCPKCPMVCYRRGNFTRHLTAKHKFNQTSAATLSKNMENQLLKGAKKSPPVKQKPKKNVSLESHKCSHCSYIAKWPSDLRRHMQVHTVVKRFKCSMCTNKYKYLGDLNVHMRRDHNMEPPENIVKEFTTLNVLKKASPVVFRCPICPYISHSKADLEQHSHIHGNLDKTYQCRLCEYQTYWRGDVGRHLFRHHKIILSKEAEEISEYFIYRPEIKPLTKQGNGGHSRFSSLSPSPSPDPGKNNFHEVGNNFEFFKEGTPDSNISSTGSAKNSNSKGTKEGILYCEYPNCDFKAGLADRMAAHLAVHMNLKQFVCPTCGKRTNWKWDIVKHMNKVHMNPTAGVEDVITLSIEEAKATIDGYMSSKGKKGKKSLISLCSLCDFKSWDKQHVLKHMEFMHKNEDGTILSRPLSETSHDFTQSDDADQSRFDDMMEGIETVEFQKFVEPPPEELSQYEKPYACAICNKSGSTKGDVKKHYNYTHPYKDVRILYVGDGTEFNYYTGEIYSKPLKLESPSDTMETKQGTSTPLSPASKSHRPDSKFSNPKMHGYVKPFKCSICGLRSNWKWDLKKHLRSKHQGEGGFVIMLSIEEASLTYGKDCSPSHPKHEEYLSIPKQPFGSGGSALSPSPVPDHYLFKQPPSIKAEILADSNDEDGQAVDPTALDMSSMLLDNGATSDSTGNYWKCSACDYETKWLRSIANHINKNHATEKEQVKALPVSITDADMFDKEVTDDCKNLQTSFLANGDSSQQLQGDARLWDCHSCPFQSRDKIQIIAHMQQHSMKPFICKVCNVAFLKKSILHKHIQKVHKTEDYSALTKLNITYGAKFQNKNGKYVSTYCCQICNLESESKEIILLHLQDAHGTSDSENILKIQKYVADIPPKTTPRIKRKLHFCKLCPYRSQKKSMLTFHMTYHKPNPANKFKCKHCPYYVSTQRLLHQHQRKWHKDNNKLSWDIEEIASPPLSPHKPHMGHYSVAGIQRRHYCEKCPYTTNSKNDFIYHKQFHRPKRTAEFKCEFCDYWVVHKRLLKQHMRLHTDKHSGSPGHVDSSPAKSLYSDPGLVYDPIELTELAAIKQKMISAKITSSLPKSPSADSSKFESFGGAPEDNKFIYKNGFYRKLHKCRHCPYTNTKPRNMQLHEMMHGPRNLSHNLIKCPYCDYHVGSKGLLSHHMKVHQKNYGENLEDIDDEKMNDLEQAQLNLPQVDTLLQITRFKRFGCERCPYASAKRQHFERHLELHGSRQRYTCQYCDYSVPSSNLLIQHTKLHLMPNQNLLSSQSITNLQHLNEVPADIALASALPPADTETAVTVSVVHDHLGLYENSIYDSEPKKLYRCDRCPFANIRRDYLLSHLKFHMVPSALVCPYCDYSAPKQPLLTQHIRVHFCPLPELSDWLLENGQTERETSQRHIDLGEALKVAQEYQNQSKKKEKSKSDVSSSGKDQKEINPEGKENLQEAPPVTYICQYCDREFLTSEKLVKHELQHLIGNQFEGTVQILQSQTSSSNDTISGSQRHVGRKNSKKKNGSNSRAQKASHISVDTIVEVKSSDYSNENIKSECEAIDTSIQDAALNGCLEAANIIGEADTKNVLSVPDDGKKKTSITTGVDISKEIIQDESSSTSDMMGNGKSDTVLDKLISEVMNEDITLSASDPNKSSIEDEDNVLQEGKMIDNADKLRNTQNGDEQAAQTSLLISTTADSSLIGEESK